MRNKSKNNFASEINLSQIMKTDFQENSATIYENIRTSGLHVTFGPRFAGVHNC